MRYLTRFSLASLLLAVVAVAAALSGYQLLVLPVQRRAEARKVVAEAGLTVVSEPGAAWPWTLVFTDDELARPRTVRLAGPSQLDIISDAPPYWLGNPAVTNWAPATLSWTDGSWIGGSSQAALGRAGPIPAPGPAAWAALGRLTDVTTLDLSRMHAWPTGAGPHVARLWGLEDLDLAGVPIRDEELAALLPCLTRLKRLNLSGTHLTGNGLAALAGLTELELLILPETVAFDELALLPALPRLARIDCAESLSGKPQFDAADIVALGNLSRSPLTNLGERSVEPLLPGTTSTIVASFDRASLIPNCTTLALFGVALPRLPEDAPSRAVLGRFPHLKSLDLSRNTLRRDDLAWLAKLTELESLTVGRSELTADDWRTVAALPGLEHLTVGGGGMAGEAFEFPTQATLAGLDHFRRLSSLGLTVPATGPGSLPPLPGLTVGSVTVSLPLTDKPEDAWPDDAWPAWVRGATEREIFTGDQSLPLTVDAADLPRLDMTRAGMLTIEGVPTAADMTRLLAASELNHLRIHAADEPIPADVVAAIAASGTLETVTLWSRTGIAGIGTLAKLERANRIEVTTPEVTVDDLTPFVTSGWPPGAVLAVQARLPSGQVKALVGMETPEGTATHAWAKEARVEITRVGPGEGTRRLVVQGWDLARYADTSGWFPGTPETGMFLLRGAETPLDRAAVATLREAERDGRPQATVGLPITHLADDLADAVAAHPVETLAVSLAGDLSDADADRELAAVFALAARLPRLSTLRVASPRGTVMPAMLDRLKGLKWLETLDLQHARTDAAGRDAVGRLSGLVWLAITPAERTIPRPHHHDGAFLAPLTRLRNLNAPELRLTSDAVTDLLAANPDLALRVSPVRLDESARARLEPEPGMSMRW